MQKHWTSSLAVFALFFFGANAATALDISAEFNLGFSTIANTVSQADANNINLDLTSGDILALDVIVSNAAQDTIVALFSSLVYDTTQLTFLGGAFQDILDEGGCQGFLCSPPDLSPGIPTPIQKSVSPFALGTGTEDWIQAVIHSNVPQGASGIGGTTAALLAFQVNADLGFDVVTIASALTQGDVVGGLNGQPFAGPVNFIDAVINVPEPGTAVLLGLGLTSLSARRRKPAES